ncbi:MAG: hypothetical protein OXL41_09565 [Nitrospinae bacterium]|nr:hypothetical protein [Nitrospinota bacterium]
MNDIRFDTLKAARDLKAAGLEEAHAEAIVATMGRAMSENLATKTDLKALEQSIKALEQATRADIKALEQTTRADMTALEQKLTVRLGGLTVAGVAFLAALIKLF